VQTAHRLIVPVVLALAVVVAAPLFWWPEAAVDVWTVLFALWIVLPFGGLLLLHKQAGFSDVGTIVTASAVATFTVLGYVAIFRSDSSTAAIGVLYFPIWAGLLVIAAWLIDRGARSIVGRSADKSADRL
jgi:hypothetical protein